MSDDMLLVAACRDAEAACEQYRQRQLSRAGYPGIRREVIVLLHLAERDTTIGALATTLHVTDQDIAQRAGALEARGYLRRIGPPGDIRHRVVQLTAAGRAASQLDRRLGAELQQRLTERFGDAQIAAAHLVLTALAAETTTADGQGSPY
jgi:DNA-binding MarR family transcriptional regulator